MKRLFILFAILIQCLHLKANDAIDSLESRLRNNSQIQEKIYIHTDNNSYFAGDTIWYKAYVLRADNLQPTHMSKLLYVELLTPDGYLVERQRIVIDHNTQTFGQFCLPDTIYSGYYEMRAYTRWQLNFNVSAKEHDPRNEYYYVDKKYIADFYRDYDGLYSRVLAIYDKPRKSGNYIERYITGRPKRHQIPEDKGIIVKYFPEGGSLVSGLESKVAFEVLDANGRPLCLEGVLDDGTIVKSNKDGRGVFTINTMCGETHQCAFLYQGKKYAFPLPTCNDKGAIINYDALHEIARIQSNGVDIGGVSVSCRGKLVSFSKEDIHEISTSDLPTGVNEIVVYDKVGNTLSSRYVFVNHKDLEQKLPLSIRYGGKRIIPSYDSANPFEEVSLQLHSAPDMPISYSIAVRDPRGDLPSYDDGNILTDLLLAGDLRGFVAHPAYYFESEDDDHRLNLDLLLMIQGWKKYGRTAQLLYRPERALTVEGETRKVTNLYMEKTLQENLSTFHKVNLLNPCVPHIRKFFDTNTIKVSKNTHNTSTQFPDYDNQVLLEIELNKGNDYSYIMAEPDSEGKYLIYLPPFYGKATLSMCAYQRKDSVRYCLSSSTDIYKFNPYVTPNYEIRRKLFFPQWTKPYSWYQTHTPEDDYEDFDSISSGLHLSVKDHILDDVTVKRRRRQVSHVFDRNKPALTFDFSDLYNQAYDYGLFRTYNAYRFWHLASDMLFGSFNDYTRYVHNSVSIDGHYFIKPKDSDLAACGVPMNTTQLSQLLHPRRIGTVRIFTDYDRRNGVGREPSDELPTAWFQLFSIPDGGSRAVRRDRRIEIDGIAYPEQFYHRDYSNMTPDSTDYRRTLYWNPNAHPDAEGNLNIKFYNNSRRSMLKVSICGVSADGKIYYY